MDNLCAPQVSGTMTGLRVVQNYPDPNHPTKQFGSFLFNIGEIQHTISLTYPVTVH